MVTLPISKENKMEKKVVYEVRLSNPAFCEQYEKCSRKMGIWSR